ncbi:B-cell differentiation antigen CD72-like [Numida meleagris]|uniref:B-cell differentiation antigen CD72-like n=1 Tax=Numida meleagris TaxID=8996 RepID=UPI000B3D9AB7|nr:B-cell differentiation antigen CD72-like [Numida meleagris]
MFWCCRANDRVPVPAAVHLCCLRHHSVPTFAFASTSTLLLCTLQQVAAAWTGQDRTTGSPMAQSVLYADLRFAKGPGGHGTASQLLEAASSDDTDSPYENVIPGSAPTGTAGEGTQHSPRQWSWRRCVPAGLLAASLLLLVALVAVGTCYWQVTRQLQNISLEQAAERSHFSQEAQVWEQSLEQAQQELAQVQEELQQAWQEGNSSQQELARREAELVRVSGVLDATQKELQDVQEKLSASEQAASSLRVCLNADCCPSGWLLYHGKCLFISALKKSWWDGHWDCVGKSSQLLVQGGWESWMLPHFLQADGAKYWIRREDPYSSKWYDYSGDCALLVAGKMQSFPCKKPYPWICEQPPALSRVSESLTPLLTKD